MLVVASSCFYTNVFFITTDCIFLMKYHIIDYGLEHLNEDARCTNATSVNIYLL